MKKILLPIFLISVHALSQAPAGYYDSTVGLAGYALKSTLHDIISVNNINWHYGDLPSYYNQTDLDVYYDHGSTNTSILLDMYSEIPTGPDAYEYTSENLIGSAVTEGLGWNREHMMPQSTFYSNYPMYSDLFFVLPTDAKINQLRSNYPYGITGAVNHYTFTNSSKIGNCAIPNYPYTGRVYEPIDEFKGDVARSLLYFVVRYEGKLGTFKYNSNANPASDSNPLDGTEERAFDPAYMEMLIQWHHQDPVSQREIDRNNAVYNLQNNRNPFIDNPDWVDVIWEQNLDSGIPSSPINLEITQNSAYFSTLSWSPSTSSGVIGYKIYQNGNLIGSTKDNFYNADHLTPSTSYTYTVKAYNNKYLFSGDSNTVLVTTLATDVYAKDLLVTKYIHGSGNNKAIEITNKTGHSVNLNDYRLSIQFYNSNNSNYYFPAPYELEGVVQHNETFVILNPKSNFSCFTTNQAKFATAAPQMTFNGMQYLELRYKSKKVDAIGISNTDNSSVLENVSLYRNAAINQPSTNFNLTEWDSYANDYCQDLGVVSPSEAKLCIEEEFKLYPNPALDYIFVSGKIENIQTAQILDFSGRLIYMENVPFKSKKNISVQHLKAGSYLLKLDNRAYPFIKK